MSTPSKEALEAARAQHGHTAISSSLTCSICEGWAILLDRFAAKARLEEAKWWNYLAWPESDNQNANQRLLELERLVGEKP